MQSFVVVKPGGMKDHDFEAYRVLLEEIGIDLSSVLRIPEPDTGRRWLYAWSDRTSAQRFARELRLRTRDDSWAVRDLEIVGEEVGPLAPLDVIAEPVADGTVYRLSPASQERIMRRFPNARLAGEVFFSTETQQGYERNNGSIWNQVIVNLSGLSQTQVKDLGGYRVYEIGRRTLYESASAAI